MSFSPHCYMYHYYEAERGPFQNFSSLSEEEAHSVLNQLKQDKALFASKRSDDYLEVRRKLERRAREMFIRKDGKPVVSYPHYMTLGPCDWLKQWYQNGKELRIHIDEIDPLTVSFTYGDLFPTMRFKDGKPYREQIYLKDEIMNVVEKFGWPQQWNADGTKGPERYIEVQLWDHAVIEKYVNG